MLSFNQRRPFSLLRLLRIGFFAACISFICAGVLCLNTHITVPAFAQANGSDRIHILTHTYSDCIIIESNGLFGIVDSGEDNDYPDGSDDRYPLRLGITIGQGHEDEVIAYLYSLGVTQDNLEFYIGTHPHSDHIGSADEIIREFHPKRVYTPAYDDSLIGPSNLLWDNQYVYDNLIAAAEELAIPVILNLDPSAPLIPLEYSSDINQYTSSDTIDTLNNSSDDPLLPPSSQDSTENEVRLDGHVGNPNFQLGNFTIEIVNYGTDYQSTSANTGNNFSWGVVAEAHGRRAFLGGDIDDTDGDETRLAATLGHVDLMKLNHHGGAKSNTAPLIRALNPTCSFQTGRQNRLWGETYTALTRTGTRMFASDVMARQGLTAFVADFNPSGVFINAMDGTIHYDITEEHPFVYVHLDGYPYPLYGWQTFNGITYWFENSASPAVACWLYDNHQWYWLNEYGEKSTGFTTINNHMYLFDDNGALYTNQWVDFEGARYRVNEAGEVQYGWFALDGKSYYLDPSSGVMVSGTYPIGDKTYYFLEDGSLKSGWIEEEGTWHYYTGTSEAPQTGWIEDNGLTYYADKQGERLTGWQSINKSWYYFDNAGVVSKGWKKLDAVWYYLTPESGKMATGWFMVDGTWYFANNAGAMQTGWLRKNATWYYLDPIIGDMKTGWFTVDGVWYFANQSGAMLTGWVNDQGLWYYLSNSGAMVTGWFKAGGIWYYANESGVMQTGWLWDNFAWYYLSDSGAMCTGWQWINGEWYYLNPSGTMATGWQYLSGTWYYLARSGAWIA